MAGTLVKWEVSVGCPPLFPLLADAPPRGRMPCPAEQWEVINTFVFELEAFLALGVNASVAGLASLSPGSLSRTIQSPG